MSKHTAAPWTAEVSTTCRSAWPPQQNVTISAGRKIIATYETSFVEYPDDDTNAANARLIAAAPELLEALKAAQRWMPVYPASADVIVGGREAHAKAVESIRAAIAKAEGA